MSEGEGKGAVDKIGLEKGTERMLREENGWNERRREIKRWNGK